MPGSCRPVLTTAGAHQEGAAGRDEAAAAAHIQEGVARLQIQVLLQDIRMTNHDRKCRMHN
jgi:hypothetical protein